MSKDDRGINFVTISEEEFVREALKIVKEAESNGIQLRILGALAVYVHCMNNDECKGAIKRLGRFGEGKPIFTDLDLIGYSNQRRAIIKLFKDWGYRPFGMFNALFGDRRLIFEHPDKKFRVDVFLSKLEFSHDVEFGDEPSSGRLKLDYPTISLADIVLEKLQIHEINRKDLIDLIVLFMAHDVGNGVNDEVIDADRISSILCKDWGFWYDAINNLQRVKTLAGEFLTQGKLSESNVNTVRERVERLMGEIDMRPKSKDWEKRAKIGTSKKWYRDVEELVR